MSEVAIMARVYPVGLWAYELEPIVPREPLPRLRICTHHPKLVYFDDLRCPCCGMEAENDMLIAGLALAKGTGKP